MTAAWWAAHPDVRDVVDALDGLVIATAVRSWGLGEPARLPLKSEPREGHTTRTLSVLAQVSQILSAHSLGDTVGADRVVTVHEPEVRRVIDASGRKRTCVVVELQRGRTRRALVIDTEAP
jgi:hypothetical protein